MKKKRRKRDELLSAIDRIHAESTDQRVRTLLHELEVHGEEITVQNEQLLKAQSELEMARDRYADLYDFAPVGYLALDARGVIREINLVGSQLLGRDRAFLVNMPLAALVVQEQRDRVRELVAECLATPDRAQEAEVRVKGHQERVLTLIARPMHTPSAGLAIFLAMLDVTTSRRLQKEKDEGVERERLRTIELADEVATRLGAEERIKALLDRLIGVQEQERRRIALNLHDHLGQQLTALRLTVDAIKEDHLSRAELNRRLDAIDSIVTQLDRDVDNLARELRPAALDDVGLEAALEQLVQQWSRINGVHADLHATPAEGSRLPAEIESHLFRIVQESLNNVSKHANASQVSILLERRPDEVRLIVEDDGCGFDLDEIRNQPSRGMGLAGMHERAASIGAQFECESSIGQGTTLFVRVPLNRAAPAA